MYANILMLQGFLLPFAEQSSIQVSLTASFNYNPSGLYDSADEFFDSSRSNNMLNAYRLEQEAIKFTMPATQNTIKQISRKTINKLARLIVDTFNVFYLDSIIETGATDKTFIIVTYYTHFTRFNLASFLSVLEISFPNMLYSITSGG